MGWGEGPSASSLSTSILPLGGTVTPQRGNCAHGETDHKKDWEYHTCPNALGIVVTKEYKKWFLPPVSPWWDR